MNEIKEDTELNKGKNPHEEKSKCQINDEYFKALSQWLQNVRSFRQMFLFTDPSFAMFPQQFSGFPQQPSLNGFIPPVIPLNQTFFNQQQQQQQNRPNEGVEYVIPPLWKRFVAELIDLTLLFIVKLAVTFIAVDFMDFMGVERYDFLHHQTKITYKLAMEFTSDILFLEMIHIFIAWLYEAIFLRRGLQNQTGGATPGKIFMGIRVVLCNKVEQVDHRPNVVKIFPATDIGLKWSITRAFLKNLVLALLFPFCSPFFLNKFNRTAYDILSHTIVVEDRVDINRDM